MDTTLGTDKIQHGPRDMANFRNCKTWHGYSATYTISIKVQIFNEKREPMF